MTESSIKEARKLLTAEDAACRLEVALAQHKADCEKFDCIPQDWMPQTAAALEWAIELLKAEQAGMLLHADLPIGTTIYWLNKGERVQERIIDGEKYTRKVPNWYITKRTYDWVFALCDAERPERQQPAHVKYYLTLEEARAERDRINAGNK